MAPKIVTTDKPFTVFSVEADKDYLLARAMNIAGSAFHSRAGYSSHQACEKYLKAFMLQESGSYSEGHKLPELREICSKHDEIFNDDQIVETLRILDEFEQVGRYGAAANFDPGAQTTESIKTSGVMMWSAVYIDRLDHFVFEARGRLDFRKVGYADDLSALMNGKKTTQMSSWELKPPLSVVLTRGNKYFKRNFK